jgi:pyruvate/2-oxoglutarate dehydrogenase complex dihydrolipoamide dehydrogenase (E3) component
MSSDSSEVTISTLGDAPASISKLSASPDPSEAPSTTVLVAGGGICGLLCGLALSALGVDCHIYEQRGTSGTSQSGDVAYIITEELDKFLAAHKVAVVSSSRSLLAIAQLDPLDRRFVLHCIGVQAFAAGTCSIAQRRDEACFPR